MCCMTKRVTIMINGDLDRKVWEYQARTIQDANRAYSYSRTVNDLLARDI